MKARKENKVYSITTEQEKQRYLKEGYDIYSDEGKLQEYSPLKKISYSQYDALRRENDAMRQELLARRGENEAYRAENETLRRENSSLREELEALQEKNSTLQKEAEALKTDNAGRNKSETAQAEGKASGKKAGG